MYTPNYIKIKNIGSIKNIDYDFKTSKSQLIQGLNLDNKGQKNNGVGKSFFIDCIGISLSGIILSGRSIDEFIRDGENEGSIEMSLKNGDSVLLIKRFFNRKKPQLIEIYINGEDKHKDLPDVNLRNQ